MTQVVNGYLAWTFSSYTVRVITSRDGSTGLRALALFAGAALRIAFLRHSDRDLVVVHLSQGGSFVREGALLRLATLRGLATVAHLHGSGFVDFAAKKPHRVRRVLQSASRVFVLSEQTRDAAATFVPDDRVVLVPNAVPAGHPRSKERRIVFGGAVSRRKGVDVLIAAWAAATASGAADGWTLDIVGPLVEPSVIPADLSGAVVHGALPHARLMELLDRSELAVLPSRDEAMPMFILEALARDNGVVASRVGGIPAVIGDGAGVLVEPGDAKDLETALARLMAFDDERLAIRRAGSARFQASFSAAAVYPELEDHWTDALRAGSGGGPVSAASTKPAPTARS